MLESGSLRAVLSVCDEGINKRWRGTEGTAAPHETSSSTSRKKRRGPRSPKWVDGISHPSCASHNSLSWGCTPLTLGEIAVAERGGGVQGWGVDRVQNEGKRGRSRRMQGYQRQPRRHLLRASFHPILPLLTEAEAVEEYYCLTVRDLTVLGL